jgi:hypothetical protein
MTVATGKAMQSRYQSGQWDFILDDKRASYSQLQNNIASHAINVKCLKTNDFNGFFEKRCNALLEMIGKAMGKKIVTINGHFEEYQPEDFEEV